MTDSWETTVHESLIAAGELALPTASNLKPFEKSRDAHSRETTEDYLEAIAGIIATNSICRSRDLAKHFGVSHVTVHKIVERLRSQSLVVGEPYQPIKLTCKGEHIAAESKRRHEIVYHFLIAIGISPSIASVDSEGIEHHVSPETLRKLEWLTSSLSAEQGQFPMGFEFFRGSAHV
ncbi:manganese-binding transcriptional regulator MntR [Pirellulaceae bacterium SH501]